MPRKRFGIGFTRRGGAAGGAPAWSPSAYGSALKIWAIPSPTYCTTDTAGGTPCADGDPIRWWYNQADLTWYEQATLANRLVLKSAGGGKWYAQGVIAGGRYHTFVSIATACFLATSVRLDASYAGTNTRALDGVNNYLVGAYSGRWRAYNIGFATGSACVPGESRTLIGSFQATGGTLYLDGVLDATGPGTGTSPGSIRVGAGVGEAFADRIYGAVCATGTPTATVTQLHTYLRSLQP